MTIANALRELGAFLDECESASTVTGVELTHESDTNGERPLSAEIQVSLPLENLTAEDGLTLEDASVDPAGGLSLGFESATPIVPSSDHDVDIEVTDASFESDGTVTVTLGVSMPVGQRRASSLEESTSTVEETDEPTTPASDRDVPPFRDPELLQEVYDSCETFAEMTDEIGMDVTAETVRRYMIDHGIHEPDSYETTESQDVDSTTATADGHPQSRDLEPADAEQPSTEDVQNVYLADGIGLPEDVTAETLIETVKRSTTLHEVKRDLDMERQEVLEMLKELDMVDLVLGSLGTETERDITREDVIERLREASAAA